MQFARRMRRRAGLFSAVAGVCALLSGLALGIAGFTAAAESRGVQAELAARSGAELALRATLESTADADAQDAAMRELIAGRFAGLDVQIHRTQTTFSTLPLAVGGEDAGRATAAAIPDLDAHATLVDGSWPRSGAEVSVQADAAQALGIVPGATIRLGDGEFTVAGTWRLDDPRDPRWIGDRQLITGDDGAKTGPIVVDADSWQRLGGRSSVHWSIVPTLHAVDADELRGVISAWRGFEAALEQRPQLDASTFEPSGRLVRTAVELLERVDALRAVQPIAALFLMGIGFVALLELSRLLGAVRSSETLLIWSRGASPARLAATVTAEAVLAAALGSMAGAAIALWIVGSSPLSVPAPVAVVLVAAATFGIGAWLQARDIVRRERLQRSGRLRRLGAPAGLVLVCAAAALSTWQLLLYGSPVTVSRSGESQVDPIAVLAPVLLVLAVAAVAIAATPAVAGAAERRAVASRGLPPAHTARSLARIPRLVVTPMVLCALAAGQLVVAAGFAATWDASYTENRAVRAGAPIRVLAGNATLDVAELESLATGASLAPASVRSTVVGTDETSIVGLAPQALSGIATEYAPEARRAAALLEPPATAPLLPAGSRELRLELASSELAGPPSVTVLLTDPLGVALRLPVSSSGTATLPVDRGELTLAGFELAVEVLPVQPADAFVSITRVTADGTDVPTDGLWVALDVAPASTPSGLDESASPRASLAEGSTLVRILPGLGEQTDTVSPPIVVSQAFADRNGLEVDDVVLIALDPRWTPVPCVVTAVVPTVPGAARDAAVLIDIRVLEAIAARTTIAGYAADQVWIATAEPAAVADALRPGLPPGARLDVLAEDPARMLLSTGAWTLWIGSIGALALAIVAVAAVAGAQATTRRAEVLLLRALGAAPRQLARMRAAEFAVVLGCGLVAGAAAGFVAAFVTLPDIARAAVPSPHLGLPTEVAFALTPLAVGSLALAALLVAVVLGYGVVVLRQARSVVREEAA